MLSTLKEYGLLGWFSIAQVGLGLASGGRWYCPLQVPCPQVAQPRWGGSGEAEGHHAAAGASRVGSVGGGGGGL